MQPTNIKSKISSLINIASFAISIIAISISYSSYEREKTKESFNFELQKKFSTEKQNGIELSESFFISVISGYGKEISTDVYSALSYVDASSGKENIIPVRYVMEIKNNSFKDETLVEYIGKNNNVHKMNALADLRKSGAGFIKDARIVSFFEFSYEDIHGYKETTYFVDGKYFQLSRTSKNHFDKFKAIYSEKSSQIIDINDLNFESLQEILSK